ncbi:hypothetical protein ACFL34_04970, partial [Candidatus Sumerlaeota bacterium]
VLCARFLVIVVWILRRILWLLGTVGHMMSCFLLRQMEYGADQHQVRLIGNKTFEETMRRINLLGLAFQGAMHDLRESWRERRLSDDVALLVAYNVEEIPAKLRAEIEAAMREGQTGLFDTHPVDHARIDQARTEETDGVFRLQASALDLFRGYAKFARLTSAIYYNTLLGQRFDASMLAPTKELQERRKRIEQEQEIQRRYFQGMITALNPLIVVDGRLEPPEDYEELGKSLLAARKRMKAALPTSPGALKSFELHYDTIVNAQIALALREAGFNIRARDFGLEGASERAIRAAHKESSEFAEQLSAMLTRFNQAARVRLTCSLTLLHHDKLQRKMGSQFVPLDQVQQLYESLATLAEGFDLIQGLYEDYSVLGVLLNNLPGNEDNHKLRQAIEDRIVACNRQLEQVFRAFNARQYPFDHTAGDITLAGYLVGGLPHVDDTDSVRRIQQTIDNFYTLYFRLLGRLAQIAEDVETVVGIKPWPRPPE